MRDLLPRLNRSSSAFSGGPPERGSAVPAYLFPYFFLGFIVLLFAVVIWMIVSSSRDRRRARQLRQEEAEAYWEAQESAERSTRTALVDADTAE